MKEIAAKDARVPFETRAGAESIEKKDIANSRSTWFFPLGCLVVLISLAVRLPRLADHSVWWDEGFAIYEARLPLLAAAYRTAFDVHPPLHYWFLHFWIRLVGEGEFAVRYSTVLFAVLSVAVLAWVGRRLVGPWAGLLAALFLALARIYIEWSQEMRMYTLSTVLTALMLYFTVALCQKPTRRRWLGLVIVGTIALYTLYIAGLTLLAVGLGGLVYGLFQRTDWQSRWHWFTVWLSAAGAVTVLYLPWLIVLAVTTRPSPQIEWTLDFPTFVHAYLTVLPLGVSTYLDRYMVPTGFATLLLLIGIVAAWRSPRQRPLAVAGTAMLVLTPLTVYVMSLPNPVYFKPNLEIRYVLILLPAYDLLLAWAIQSLWKLWRPASVLTVMVMLGISSWAVWTYYPTKIKVDDYPSLVRFISAHAQSGDEIVLYPDRDWPIFGYYNHTGLPLFGVGTAKTQTAAGAAKLGAQLLADHPSLWLVSIDGGHDSDPNGYLAKWLAAHTRDVGNFHVANKEVQLLSRDPKRTLQGWTLPPERSLQGSPVPNLQIVGLDLALNEIPAGQNLNLAVYWQASANLASGERAVIDLENGQGQIVLQRSWPLALQAGEKWRGEYTLPIPAELPAGQYSLTAGARGSMPVGPTNRVRLAAIQVDSHAPPLPPLTPGGKTVAQFGRAIALERVDLTVNGKPVDGALVLHPGDKLNLTLNWLSLAATDRRYTVFAHLVGPPNPTTKTPLWAQKDQFPGNGARATDGWLPGQRIADPYQLIVPTDAPAGAYWIEIGLYEQPTGQRAPVQTSGEAGSSFVVARGMLTR